MSKCDSESIRQSSTTDNLKSVTLQNQVKLENLQDVDRMKHISDVSGSSQNSKAIDSYILEPVCPNGLKVDWIVYHC